MTGHHEQWSLEWLLLQPPIGPPHEHSTGPNPTYEGLITIASGSLLVDLGNADGDDNPDGRFDGEITRAQLLGPDGLRSSSEPNYSGQYPFEIKIANQGSGSMDGWLSLALSSTNVLVGPLAPVPEAGTWTLALCGLGVVGWRLRVRRAAKA